MYQSAAMSTKINQAHNTLTWSVTHVVTNIVKISTIHTKVQKKRCWKLLFLWNFSTFITLYTLQVHLRVYFSTSGIKNLHIYLVLTYKNLSQILDQCLFYIQRSKMKQHKSHVFFSIVLILIGIWENCFHSMTSFLRYIFFLILQFDFGTIFYCKCCHN